MSKIVRQKNKLGVYNTTHIKNLKLAIHPDKGHLDESVANDLMSQFNNSLCSKTKVVPCIIKFKNETDVDYIAFALNKAHEIKVEQAADYCHQVFTQHISTDNAVHHSVLTKAVCDYFDTVLLYS